MTRAELIALVKIKIDELVPESELTLVSSANTSINTINETIDSLINESAVDVLLACPINLCPVKQNTASVTITNNVGLVRMPTDYLRFGYVKFAVWKKVIHESIQVGSKLWDIQQNDYIRGGYKKPVVALGTDLSGFYLELYTIKTSDVNNGREIGYVAKPAFGEDITNANNVLSNSLSWLIASKVMQIYKNDAYKVAYEQYLNTFK